MEKMYTIAEIEKYTDENGVEKTSISHYNSEALTRDEAVAKARTKATKNIGDVYGIFVLEGTVTHPIPELDVVPVA